MEIHFRHRFADKASLILDDFNFDISRQCLFNSSKPDLNRVRNGDRVRPRLTLNEQADGVETIQTAQPARFFNGILGPTDISNTDRVSLTIGDDQFIKLFGSLHSTQSPQDKFSRTLIDDSTGNFDVLGLQCDSHIFDREFIRGEFFRVDDDIDGSGPCT